MPTQITTEQALRFRLHGLGLAEPARSDPRGALAGWAVQDSPPGAATAAVLARTTADVEPGWLDEAISGDRSVASLYNARTATSILPAHDAPSFATALLPTDDAGLKALLLQAIPEQKTDLAEPVGIAVDAISDALDGRALSRDDLHEALRERLPKALLPWCEGCQSHHARRGLLVMASLNGRLCLAGKVGRQPLFARSDQWLGGWQVPPADDAGRALVSRYLSAYGPSSPADFAAWAGLANRHAKALWALVEDELEEVTVDDGPVRWLLASDRDRLSDAGPVAELIVVGAGDPLLQARDRELVVPDPAARKRVWTAIPTAGLVLVDGAAAAVWKAKKSGKRLDVTLDPLGKAPAKPVRERVEAPFARLAPHRGATSVALTWT